MMRAGGLRGRGHILIGRRNEGERNGKRCWGIRSKIFKQRDKKIK